MSVLIKGMDMPTDCGHCRFAVDGWCYAYGKPNIAALSNKERTNFCPLIELPPHGRLIDADALEQQMVSRKNYVGRLSDPLCLVQDAPAIIEAEEEE